MERVKEGRKAIKSKQRPFTNNGLAHKVARGVAIDEERVSVVDLPWGLSHALRGPILVSFMLADPRSLPVSASNPLPITTSLLLSSLRNEQDGGGWKDFHARYWPVLVGLGVHLGLRETDAQDAAQWTLLEFLKEFRAGTYERGKGRLRAYILGIARNRIRSLRRSAQRPAQAAKPLSDAHETPDDLTDAVLEAAWERERRGAILREALEQLRASPKLSPATFQAFELVTLRSVPAEEAGRQTGLSVEDVYLARHRCTKRLKELTDTITKAWDDED